MKMKELNIKNPNGTVVVFTAIGAAIGAVIGTTTGNVGLWVGLGASLGCALGFTVIKESKPSAGE